MKKYFLPGLAAAGGLAGFALRAWQLSAAADPASGIFRSGHPATLALVLLSAAMALLFHVVPDNAPRTALLAAGAAALAGSAVSFMRLSLPLPDALVRRKNA